MVKKTITILIIGVFALIFVSLIFKNAISSCIVSLFSWPYVCSNTVDESIDKGVFLFKYQPSKNVIHGKNGETLIRIIDAIFVEKKYKLSCKNMKGIDVLDSSFILVIPCQYEDSVFQNYFYKWELKSPFSAHPKKICAHFEKGSANKYTYPPDTLTLSLIYIDNKKSDTYLNNNVIDSIILFKDYNTP